MGQLRPILVSMIGCLAGITVLAAGPNAPARQGQPSRATEEIQRIRQSIDVLSELAHAPDNNIPQSLVDSAEAVVVIPTLVKGGFVIGAKHGRGVMSARDRDTHAWSVPVFVTMTGGTIGWQIGLESIDLSLLVMNRRGVDALLDDKFTLGGDLSVAAGPVGRSASAATDAKATSQILAYSRAHGLFAGATLDGAALHPDKDANRALYGPEASARELLTRADVAPSMPAVVAEWRTALNSIGARTTAGR